MFLDRRAKKINKKTKTIAKAKDNAGFRTRTKQIDIVKEIKRPMVETTAVSN